MCLVFKIKKENLASFHFVKIKTTGDGENSRKRSLAFFAQFDKIDKNWSHSFIYTQLLQENSRLSMSYTRSNNGVIKF